ncbi:hypothetical protein Cadr_000011192 [Camelus dromedarius]|uniref:Uncharacterized protein n=1 Tax=Camelus dromedarius TaxID=9838 RepID=A0A5N4DUS3_CAMDR|nr:hypothetical protein Cadr_000011192 [Camelus dromedarius]
MLVATIHFRTPSGAWSQTGCPRVKERPPQGEEHTPLLWKSNTLPSLALLWGNSGGPQTESRWAARPGRARSPVLPDVPRFDSMAPNSHTKDTPILHSCGRDTHLNVLLARHEDKDVHLQGLLHCGLHIILLRGLQTSQEHHQKRALRRRQARHPSEPAAQPVLWD